MSRPVGPDPDPDLLRQALGDVLPVEGEDPQEVVAHMARAAEPGLVQTTGPRYFGFVVGGALPAAVAADHWTTTHDQSAGFYVLSPASAVIESITAEWILDLLELPREAAVGFTTGCQMASVMGIAAGRHVLLDRMGWNVARQGLRGAPELRVIVGEEAHGTIGRALALVGLGSGTVVRIPCDDQGRMRADALEQELEGGRAPALVCAQAGNVNTGSFDPFELIGPLCRRHDAWLHVDGAFGLWARASADRRSLADGVEVADSWATDGHKYLNVPYDCGMVVVRRERDLMAATTYEGAYLVRSQDNRRREGCYYTPESSRRARATPVYAALRQLGRQGVDDLVTRTCRLARLFAELLIEAGGEVPHDVVLNQVMVRFPAPDEGQGDAFQDALIQRIQREGTCWLGGTTWRGRRYLRISVCNWQTRESDVRASVAAILGCLSDLRP